MNKPTSERMREFVDYHINGDGECNAIVLKRWADNHELSKKDRFDLAYFFSITYCVETGIILYSIRDWIRKEPETVAKAKNNLIFQSDRRWVKIQDRFLNTLNSWKNLENKDYSGWWLNNNTLDLNKAISTVENWYYFARFAAFLFVETYSTLLDCKITKTSIDWKNGDTATSGLLNLYGYDEFADKFDKKGELKLKPDKMDTLFDKLVKYSVLSGSDANTTKLETSLCAYRKFYKGTRYNGFYLDRMLEELRWYQKTAPQYNRITEELFKIRAECFPNEVLGEYHGWNGIRKELKKLYKEYGII